MKSEFNYISFFKKKVYENVENIVYICLILLRRNGTMVL